MAAPENVTPKIVLIPHSRSHPFAQRECDVLEAQKVGRPVDKKKISQFNFIFDCRVLSRNHALIWFENGKFWIKDTKSSNGTFVNDCRLSPSGEESPAKELKTRDVIQFGVNVNVEKRGEVGVTHGCIIATVKLFIDEKEIPGPDPDIQEVMQIVQNSLAHELELETKLASMQEVLAATHSFAKENMINIVKEDELLSRLEMLENQLHACSRNTTETELQKQMKTIIEEKHKREATSKETIQKMLQEKIESSSKLSRLQRDYDKAEEECQKYRTLYENLKQEHSQQVTKLNEAVKLAESASKEIEEKNKDEMEQLLTSKEVLQVDLDFTKNELSVTKVKLKETNEQLENLRYQLELNPSKVTNVIENAVVNDTGSNESGYVKHGIESLENGEINEAVKQEQVTLLESADPHSTLLVSSAKENEVLKVRLTASEERIKSLVDEIDNLKLSSTDSERQFERLRGQLQEKSLSEQNKTNEIMELTSTIEQQRSELENLRSEVSAIRHGLPDVTDMPNELDSYQNQLFEFKKRTEILDKNLNDRENDLAKVKNEKTKLEERLISLELDHELLVKDNKQRQDELQAELENAQSETKSLTSQLQQLKTTLADTMANSIVLPSPSDESLLEGPPPDLRLKFLSVVTLISIVVALISSFIAYFF